MNQDRVELLSRLESEAAPGPLHCEKILTALFIPALDAVARSRARREEFPPPARPRLRRSGAVHPPLPLRAIRGDDRALQVRLRARAARTFRARSLSWRLHFIMGALSYTLAGTDALKLIAELNPHETDNDELLLRRLAPFLLAGLQAPLPELSDVTTRARRRARPPTVRRAPESPPKDTTMLILIWAVAGVIAATALAYANAPGVAWTLALAALLGVSWATPILPFWANARADGVRWASLRWCSMFARCGACSSATGCSRCSAKSCRRCRRPSAKRSKPAPCGGTASFSPVDPTGRGCSPSPQPAAQRRRAALPRPRGRGALRDDHRLGDHQRLQGSAAARVAVHQGQAAFFGMIIAKEYGGLGFSAYAHSQVMTKLVDALRHGGGHRAWSRTRSGRASCSRTTAPTSRSAITCRASRRAWRFRASR